MAATQTELQDPELFMALEDLELVARGIVEGALHGLHQSPYVGFSVEFNAHREYQLGDDLRYVNWNLWGRTDRLYIKQFKSDTNLNLYLLLDCTASMLCANGPTAKWRYGARALAALAFLALNTRDATGLFLLQSGLEEFVPPFVRPGQFHEILALLERARPRGPTNLAKALAETSQLCRRRGLVVVVSDLFDQDEGILGALRHLRHHGHDVIVVHLLDPWEADLPESGQFEFQDLETGARLRTNVEPLRTAYRRAVADWRDRLQRRAEDAGIDWLSCETSAPLRDVLINYLLRRSRLC